MNDLDLHLAHLMLRLSDPIDALQFCTDLTYPLTDSDRTIALQIRSFFDYFSDSTVNDLLAMIDDLAPITFRSNPTARYAPYQVLTISFPNAAPINSICTLN